MSTPDVSEELRRFADRIELDEIGTFELAAYRGAAGADGRRAVVGPGTVAEEDAHFETANEVSVHWADGEGLLLVRLRAVLRGRAGEIRAGCQAQFRTGGLSSAEVSREVQDEYISRVAAMMLVPYVRAAVADLALRTFGIALTLGAVRPGQLSLQSISHEEPPRGASGASISENR